jgi:hypothetical protein
MRPHRSTIAGMMVVVALAALDCLGARVADFLAGCWLVGVTMQVGLFAVFRSRGWYRRFWAGFEATGIALLLAYAAGSHTSRRVVNGWAHRVTEGIYGAFLRLPADAFQWCFDHGLVIDPRKPLKVYEVVAVFEVAYGLPILLLAGVGGALAAWLWSPRAPRALATAS